ncbi:MAG: DUF177 domain-containing protein [Muribaculaceae bacterium]|nr:DUF177 domain-containing protein [Muribaculaceae bacterium]MDE6486817.1 DUF177 domain-containing protein [Muribaculaceae bacterium]
MGKFTAFKLPLKSLTKGTHTFDYHLDKQFFANMENTDVRDADINVHLTVDYNGDVYALTFALTGEVVLLCDRCLDDLHLPIETGYNITVKYGDDYNDDSDTLLEIPDSDNFLNVAYMIYDTVVLAIPIKHVHPLGKCNRQMSAILKKHRAGGDVTDEDAEFLDGTDDDSAGGTDPRWEALRGLGGGDDE